MQSLPPSETRQALHPRSTQSASSPFLLTISVLHWNGIPRRNAFGRMLNKRCSEEKKRKTRRWILFCRRSHVMHHMLCTGVVINVLCTTNLSVPRRLTKRCSHFFLSSLQAHHVAVQVGYVFGLAQLTLNYANRVSNSLCLR